MAQGFDRALPLPEIRLASSLPSGDRYRDLSSVGLAIAACPFTAAVPLPKE